MQIFTALLRDEMDYVVVSTQVENEHTQEMQLQIRVGCGNSKQHCVSATYTITCRRAFRWAVGIAEQASYFGDCNKDAVTTGSGPFVSAS